MWKPFPFHGGVRLANQAQFDPMPLLDSLIVELDERGGSLAQGIRVQHVSGDGDGLRMNLRTIEGDTFSVHTGQCVLATGIPVLDRGGFFARLKPNRAYCMAYRLPGNITRGMYISADSPTRSVRFAPTAEGDRLIVGGAGHPVGHARFRQVGHDKRRGGRTRAVQADPRRTDGLGGCVRQLESSRAVRDTEGHAEQHGGGSVPGEGLDHTGDTLG